MSVKSKKRSKHGAKAKPLTELPPEDAMPFEDVVRKLLAAPPPHAPRSRKKVRKATKRGTSGP